MRNYILILFTVVLFSCSQKKNESQEASTQEQPTYSGYCGYLTHAELEEAIGTKLTEMPEAITEDYLGGFGCSFAGEDTSEGANFGYIIFPSAEAFQQNQTDESFPGVGDEAYLVNGADAQQLWVREGDRFVMVAMGDEPRPEKCAILARLILDRLKTKPLNN